MVSRFVDCKLMGLGPRVVPLIILIARLVIRVGTTSVPTVKPIWLNLFIFQI